MVVVALAAWSTTSRAQDSHYWSLQNGSQATLLGGMVVANDRDLSASYYNPGSLARITDGSALSMFAKTVTTLTLTLDTTPALIAESDIGASAPGMFAAMIPGIHIVDDDVVTFSYLVRQSSKLDMSGAVLSSTTVPAEALDLYVSQDIYDGWYGLSWAREIGEFGVGTSLFFSSMSYRQRIENKSVSLPGGTATSITDNLYYTFACRRLVAKGGVTWTDGPVSLGATVTLPSMRLPFSSGTVSLGHSLVAIDTIPVAEIALSRQEDLDADYREPVSVALGAQVSAGSFDFYASAEWFGAVGSYDVLETQPLVSQTPPAEIPLPITQARDNVLNIGGGISMKATSWLSFFGSVRSDRSYRKPDDRGFVGLGAYDLHHVTAGINLNNDRFEVALGGLYASGNSEGPVSPTPLPSSPTVQSQTEFEQRGFVLAFSANF